MLLLSNFQSAGVQMQKTSKARVMAGCFIGSSLLPRLSVAHIGVLVFLYWLKGQTKQFWRAGRGFY
jgi:hypothetical protein